MMNRSPVFRFEPRWPVAVTILLVLIILIILPGRLRPLPVWFPYVLAFSVLAPMAAVGLTRGSALWRRIEQATMLIFFLVNGFANLVGLIYLIGAMISKASEISGLQLFTSSIALWIVNVLMFSLLYWQIDRGGPEARLNAGDKRPDWLFPQMSASAEDVPPGWRPNFVDYLYLGYSTATAFSTTDVMPMTSRAKMLMMIESTMSLAVIVVVGARAINILGS